ncbi:DUF3667 domain-containing protein [Aquimarina rhabdastrellae]
MKKNGRTLAKYRSNECLNCGVPLDVIDKYCHHCGQLNTTKKLAFSDLFNEFLASIFSYDSRLSHTMAAMLFKPGKISKDYIEGKRATYVNPFRFFLSISVIFFIINGFFIDFDTMSSTLNKGINQFKGQDTIITSAIRDDLKKQFAAQDELNFNLIDSLVIAPRLEKHKTKKTPDSIYLSEQQLDTMSLFNATSKRWEIYDNYYNETGEISAVIALKELKHNNTWFNRYIYKRTLKTENLNDSPMELFKYLFNKLPFIIFFFLPLFAMAIWFIYIRRSYTYMEHLVFTFHTQTMFFIMLGIAILIDQIIGDSVTAITLTFALFLLYLYKAMRKFYNQSRTKTIIKFVILNFLFLNLASIGSILAIMGSVFIF